MADCPCLVCPRKVCGCAADTTASMAICTSPEVAFLNPTGHERPDTSWRWTWLSVVRAPIAPQLTRPTRYWGVIMSRNSVPAGTAICQIEEQPPRQPQAVIDHVGLVKERVVDQSLPADRGAGLLEINAHHNAQLRGQLCDGASQQARILARSLCVVNRTGA